MYAKQDKKKENSKVTNTIVQKKNSVKQKKELIDNRCEAGIQRKLLEQPIQKKDNNTGLPDNLKMGIENLSGYAMDDVKVHYNSNKPAQLNAHAYAQGTDIHLGSGQEKHLPHEAWHIVQQKQGRVQPTTSLNGAQINDNEGLESEADIMGGKALQMIGMKGVNTSFQLKNIQPNNIQRKKAIQLMGQTQKAIEGTLSWNEVSKDWTNATHQFKNSDWQAVQCVAIERFLTNGNSENKENVTQLLESSTWDMITDSITIASLIAAAISVIAQAASASGLGWLIPISIGLIGKLISELIENQEKTTPENKSNEEVKKEKNIKSITNFVGSLAVGVTAVFAATDDKQAVFKGIGATITIALMGILELLRVQNLNRETIYGIVRDKIKSLKNDSGESTSLLPE
ncbi:hypothetical protein TSEDIMI_40097 [Tenacibaculum sediminilitoris]|uniref:eCIS core domain-containing protein n=1 Tax=Tenacibaculum sediminilitoris TaxID=1820334 RepID=UPI0038930537